MVEIVVGLDETFLERLKEVAQEYGISIDELVADALKSYLDPEVEECLNDA